MKGIKFFIWTLILLAGTMARGQDYLEGYLVEAAENNPGLKGAFNEYLAALEKVPQAGALPDPKVSFGYMIRPVETRVGPQQAKLSFMQMFPWFGTLDAREDAATAMAKSKYEVFKQQRSELFYNVRSAYYSLYFTGRAIKITEDNIRILETFRNLALVKVEAAKASGVDVLRVEMEKSDMENQLALLKDTYASLRVVFNNYLNVDGNRPVILPDVLPGKDLPAAPGAIMDSIRAGNHQILQLEFMESAYLSHEKAATRTGMPGFSLGIDYMVTGRSDNPMVAEAESGKDAIVFPMVSISIPLYRQKYRAMVREAAFMQEAATDNKSEKINVLKSAYQMTDKDYRDAERRIPLYLAQAERAQKAMNILEAGYATSGNDFEEILRMERQLLKYRLELEKARADRNAAVAFIDFLMGN